jgi:metallophosphoesterase superfamily enzyme
MLVCTVVIALLGVPVPALAADPHSAEYSNDASRLLWILHISDSHIGSEWYPEDESFIWALNDAVHIIQPDLIVNSGDLCDGSISGIPASGQEEEEWQLYRQIVDDAGMTSDYYIDIPGNHDLYGDPGFSFYLAWSLNGTDYGSVTRSHPMEFAFGKYFIYGCSTAGDEGRRFVQQNEFSQEELDELQAELTANDDSQLSLVFGHHPPGDPENADQAREIMKEHNSIYFHGHSHTYDEYIYNDLLTYQVDSLGKTDRDNVAIISVDNNYVAYEVTDSDDPWPFIVISAPADVKLKSGDAHPYSYPIGNTCEANPVRVLVFDAAEVTGVTAKLADDPEVALEQDPQRPMLWMGTFDSSGYTEGEAEFVVTATGSQERSRSITVMLANVACPDEVQPDGGIEDGDGGDEEPISGDGDGYGDDGGDDGGVGDDAGGGDDASVKADDASTAADEPFDVGGVASGGGCMCSESGEPGMVWLGLLLVLILRQRARRLPVEPRARQTG